MTKTTHFNKDHCVTLRNLRNNPHGESIGSVSIEFALVIYDLSSGLRKFLRYSLPLTRRRAE